MNKNLMIVTWQSLADYKHYSRLSGVSKNLETKGSTALTWELSCHWLKVLWSHQSIWVIHYKPLCYKYHSKLPRMSTNLEINGSTAFTRELSCHWLSLVVAPCRSIKLSNISPYDTHITPNYLEWEHILKPMAAQLFPENWAAID